MADEHRRVEPRSIVGTGMLNDPERIEALQRERERLERTWRERPKRGFGDVLRETPAKNADDEEAAGEDPRRRKPQKESKDGGKDAPAPVEVGAEVGEEERPPLPRVPPDPRARLLHQLVESKAPKKEPRR